MSTTEALTLGLAVIGIGALSWLAFYLYPPTRDKAKWVALAAVAVGGTALAIIYGKETGSVLDAKIKEHNARGKLLNAQRAAELKKAAAAESEEEAKEHIERADTLTMQAAAVHKKRLTLIEGTGDLDSDAEVVRRELDRDRPGSKTG